MLPRILFRILVLRLPRERPELVEREWWEPEESTLLTLSRCSKKGAFRMRLALAARTLPRSPGLDPTEFRCCPGLALTERRELLPLRCPLPRLFLLLMLFLAHSGTSPKAR